MEPDVIAILKKTAEYIAVAQPELDKAERIRAVFAKRAQSTAAVLVNRGLLLPQQEQAFATKLAQNPEQIFELATDLAQRASPNSLGQPSGVKFAGHDAGGKVDAFVEVYLPEKSGRG